MRTTEFIPWEGELLMNHPPGPDTTAPPPDPGSLGEVPGWDNLWIDTGGEC
jgi:hypothetical protein